MKQAYPVPTEAHQGHRLSLLFSAQNDENMQQKGTSFSFSSLFRIDDDENFDFMFYILFIIQNHNDENFCFFMFSSLFLNLRRENQFSYSSHCFKMTTRNLVQQNILFIIQSNHFFIRVSECVSTAHDNRHQRLCKKMAAS